MKRLLAVSIFGFSLSAFSWGASISGTVTDSTGTTPLEGIEVSAYQDEEFWWGSVQSAETDSDGHYAIEGLAGGTYRVGFGDVNHNFVEEYYDDAPDVDAATDLMLGVSQDMTGVNARLVTASSIAGTVTDSTGATPLEGIYVTAYRYKEFWWDAMGWANTDSNGHYTLEGLASGTYRVGFHDEYEQYQEEYYIDAPDVDVATDLVLGVSQDLTGVDARLAPAASITGTVTGPDGTPLDGVGVQTYSWNGLTWSTLDGHSAGTGSDGTYALRGLTGGIYRVRFWGASIGHVDQFYGGSYDVNMAKSIAVPEGSSIDGMDVMLAVGGHISGSVSGPSGSPPLDEYAVYAYRRKGTNWLEVGGWSWVGFEGAFDYAGLLPGTYRLWIQGQIGDNPLLGEYYADTNDFDQAQDLVLEPGAAISNVQVELALASHITGATFDASGNPTPDALVVVYQFMDGDWEYRASEGVDGDGNFDMTGLRPGTYRVKFSPWSSDLASQWFSNSATLASARDIVLGPASTASNVNARFGAASRITGTVTGPGGIPITTVEAQALRLDAGEWRLVDTDDTDDSGGYNIGGLPAGTYRLFFWPYAGNYAPEYYNNALDVSNALDVVVSGTATVSGINVSLVAGCSLSGTVTELDGTSPLSGIDVQGYRWVGSQWMELWDTSTDETGHYAFEGLPVGQVRLYFSDFYDTYVPEWYDNAPDESSAQTVVFSSAGQVLTGYDASLARVPAPPAPQPPELLDIQWTGPATWTLNFLGERDVDYRLQRMLPIINDWVDTGSIAIGTDITNHVLHVVTNEWGLFRVRALP